MTTHQYVTIHRLENIQVRQDRQRQVFDKGEIEKLKESIKTIGLLHSITLEAGTTYLLAGESRLRALKELADEGVSYTYCGMPIPLGEVPTTSASPGDDLTRQQIEYDENHARAQLTWKEKVQAEARLHKLRLTQYGEYSPANPSGWSAKATASEVMGGKEAQGGQIKRTQQRVELADYLDNPLIAGAKTEKEAIKAVEKLKRKQNLHKLMQTIQQSSSKHTLTKGDCFKELPKLASDSVDIILLDPPYGKGMNKMNIRSRQLHEYHDDVDVAFKILKAIMKELDRIAKPDAHIYIFFDPRYQQTVYNALLINGWHPWYYPLIWDKGNVGNFGNSEYAPRHCYEPILYAWRGSKQTVKHKRDVLHHEGIQKKDHGAEKPVELYKDLLSRSLVPGDTVLDPMCGSGPIFPAADALGGTAIGIEMNPDYYNLAKKRLVEI